MVNRGGYGAGWYSRTASIAQTGYDFTREEAERIAIEGATAPDFDAWVAVQPFQIDWMEETTGPVYKALVETPNETWLAHMVGVFTFEGAGLLTYRTDAEGNVLGVTVSLLDDAEIPDEWEQHVASDVTEDDYADVLTKATANRWGFPEIWRNLPPEVTFSEI